MSTWQRPTLSSRWEGGVELPLWVWRPPRPWVRVASGPLGGGIGPCSWVLNATVPIGYSRMDPRRHLGELASGEQLHGSGVGMLTGVRVPLGATAVDDGVTVSATVGFGAPAWAAAPDGHVRSLAVEARDEATGLSRPTVGTINVVACIPARLDDAALVNTIITVTEAKTQALWDLGVAATGTATDAVCVLVAPEGRVEPFGGPRSVWGARLARATHAAVCAGGRRWLETVRP